MNTEMLALGISVFWVTVGIGAGVTALTLPLLKKMHAVKKEDRKETMYGTSATEFNAIRKKEEQGIKKQPVLRLGGLTLLPTIIVIGLVAAWALQSVVLLVAVVTIAALATVALYDDLRDIGKVPGKPWKARKRLIILGLVALTGGFCFFAILPNTLTFLPFFENVSVGVAGPVLFAAWYIFWQASSMIDGIDGLSGSIFLTLFLGTAILSVQQGNSETFLISMIGAGSTVPWLYINYAPAKAYLTEIGITILLAMFATITFLLGVGHESGGGLWVGGIFGIVLIATWMSNVLQLLYRKKTGKKLLRIAPLHHHFEAIGMPSSAVVSRYTLATALSVIAGLSIFFFLR